MKMWCIESQYIYSVVTNLEHKVTTIIHAMGIVKVSKGVNHIGQYHCKGQKEKLNQILYQAG